MNLLSAASSVLCSYKIRTPAVSRTLTLHSTAQWQLWHVMWCGRPRGVMCGHGTAACVFIDPRITVCHCLLLWGAFVMEATMACVESALASQTWAHSKVLSDRSSVLTCMAYTEVCHTTIQSRVGTRAVSRTCTTHPR